MLNRQGNGDSIIILLSSYLIVHNNCETFLATDCIIFGNISSKLYLCILMMYKMKQMKNEDSNERFEINLLFLKVKAENPGPYTFAIVLIALLLVGMVIWGRSLVGA